MDDFESCRMNFFRNSLRIVHVPIFHIIITDYGGTGADPVLFDLPIVDESDIDIVLAFPV